MRTFTLVELMVGITVVAILAALAIPQVHEAQLKAKRSEVPVILDGLRAAQVAYEEHQGEFSMSTDIAHPPSTPGRTSRPWVEDAAPAQFRDLAFVPDGEVYGQYRMPMVLVAGTSHLEVRGVCDVDESGPPYFERWFIPLARTSADPWFSEVICPPGYTCF